MMFLQLRIAPVIKHSVRTTGPPYLKTYMPDASSVGKVKKMLEQDVILPSSRPYSPPLALVMVKKKDNLGFLH